MFFRENFYESNQKHYVDRTIPRKRALVEQDASHSDDETIRLALRATSATEAARAAQEEPC